MKLPLRVATLINLVAMSIHCDPEDKWDENDDPQVTLIADNAPAAEKMGAPFHYDKQVPDSSSKKQFIINELNRIR